MDWLLGLLGSKWKTTTGLIMLVVSGAISGGVAAAGEMWTPPEFLVGAQTFLERLGAILMGWGVAHKVVKVVDKVE